MRRGLSLGLSLFLVASVFAHDIWVETNRTTMRTGETVRLALKLGNHGNAHRDFQVASKVAAADRKLVVFGPKGETWELGAGLVDQGPGPREEFWYGYFIPKEVGLYLAASSFDKVMTYGPVRDIKSAKVLFAAGSPDGSKRGFDRVLGHDLEIVPLEDPTAMVPGSRVRLRVLYKGKPLANAKVSFIPRGVDLQGAVDTNYERTTNAKGDAELVLKSPNDYLIATRFTDDKAKGKGYESIHYSATLFVIVPEVPG